MKRIKNENTYLVVSISVVMVLLMVSYFTINISFRGTSAAFGNVTGILTSAYKVTYLSNYLVDLGLENDTKVELKKYDYTILDNMFLVPEGYEFVGWNTKSDGTGDNYNANDVISVTANIDLYAQWSLIVDEEEKIVYGDVNENGSIDEEDYSLIEKYVNGIDTISEQGLRNGDVNTDGNVDLIDADIIKQVCLGTEGYIGYLPNSPILKYDIYKEVSNDDTENSKGNNNSSGGGTGNGSGNGTGTGTGGNATTGGGTSNQNGTSNGNSVGNSSSVDKEDVSESDKPTVYEFKFIHEGEQYATLTCDILEDGSCMLPIPSANPVKSGYTFNGWSLGKDCYGDIITKSLMVNNGNTYYSCFTENDDVDEEENSFGTIIIIVGLWFMAISIICHLVYRFKKNEKVD